MNFRKCLSHVYCIIPQELLPVIVSLGDPFYWCLPSPQESFQQQFLLDTVKWKIVTFQRIFAVSNIRLDFRCFAKRRVSLCSFCLGLQSSFSGLCLIKIQHVLHNFWTLFLPKICELQAVCHIILVPHAKTVAFYLTVSHPLDVRQLLFFSESIFSQ